MYQIVGCSCTRAEVKRSATLKARPPDRSSGHQPAPYKQWVVAQDSRGPGRCSTAQLLRVRLSVVTPAGLCEHGRGREGSTRDELPPPEGRGRQTGGGIRDPAGRWPAGRQRFVAASALSRSPVETREQVPYTQGRTKRYCIGPEAAQFGPKLFYYLDTGTEGRNWRKPNARRSL
jgi:hypothetical protein